MLSQLREMCGPFATLDARAFALFGRAASSGRTMMDAAKMAAPLEVVEAVIKDDEEQGLY